MGSIEEFKRNIEAELDIPIYFQNGYLPKKPKLLIAAFTNRLLCRFLKKMWL